MDRLVNTIITGDALAVLRTLPDNLVQTCITSPPYYGLRDYQTETILQLEGDPQDCQHVWIHEGRNEDGAKVAQCQHCFAVKVDRQIGLEETPEAYVSKLVEVFREVRRVLREDGILWLNLGDSYAGSWGNYAPRGIKGEQRPQTEEGKRWERKAYGDTSFLPPTARAREMGLKPKDLIGIPWMVAFALRADGWYLRSDIIWSKSNCMPESVEDRPTKSHEYLFLLSKSERYFYDAQAIAEQSLYPVGSREDKPQGSFSGKYGDSAFRAIRNTRNKRSVWTVSTQNYKEAHFATFPPKLIEPCILAGTSPRACEHCGSPWERVTETTGGTWEARKAAGSLMRVGLQGVKGVDRTNTLGSLGSSVSHHLGWQPTCSCSNEGTGTCIVLDCFMGAGTTALVAIQHSRNYLGIELNEAYVKLAEKRIQHVQQHLWTGEGIA